MKPNIWIVAALLPLTGLLVLAQDAAPGTASRALETTPTAPAKKSSSVKKKVVLDPPVAAIAKNANINVRGQSSFNGETLGHLQKGDTVTVLEQITLSHPTKDEPSEWAQISMPPGIPVWINAELVDAGTKTIKPRRVNVRGGPGENYSVLGRLERGAAVKEIKSEKGWLAIEAPTNAYAYVAAEFLEIQPASAVVVTPPPAPVVAPAPVPVPAPAPEPQVVNVSNAAPPVAATTNEPVAAAPVAPAPPSSPSDSNRELEALHRAVANEAAPVSTNLSAPPAPSEPPPPRIVTREGLVRRAYNIQAPADYELHDIKTGTLIDYLQPKKGQNFKIFVGTHITVTGPEGMDPHWPRTPVLQVQSADLIP